MAQRHVDDELDQFVIDERNARFNARCHAHCVKPVEQTPEVNLLKDMQNAIVRISIRYVCEYLFKDIDCPSVTIDGAQCVVCHEAPLLSERNPIVYREEMFHLGLAIEPPEWRLTARTQPRP